MSVWSDALWGIANVERRWKQPRIDVTPASLHWGNKRNHLKYGLHNHVGHTMSRYISIFPLLLRRPVFTSVQRTMPPCQNWRTSSSRRHEFTARTRRPSAGLSCKVFMTSETSP